jgi:transmembrane sensor
MSREDERPLSDDVPVRVDRARLARQWSAVSARLEARPQRRFLVAIIAPAALVLVAMIALLVARPWRDAPGSSGVASSAGHSDSLMLPDGSRVVMASGTKLTLPSASRERVHILLDEGVVDLDVTHVKGREFVVRAGGYDVSVLGTAFIVTLEPRDGKRSLSVTVKRGRVRVAGPGADHVLEAGQSWSTLIEPKTAARDPAPAPAPDPTSEPSANVDLDDMAAAAPSMAPSASPTAGAAVEGPKELLARATELRAAGRPRDAAAALDALRRRHRTDPRAGLAAFELGRLRMDSLRDPAGAAEAFGDAIALAPSAPFREDAEARRVEALEALPDRGRCERARDAYLARYPTGLHARRIGQRCKSP